MFHITRWKRPTMAAALSVAALSMAPLTSPALAAGKTISAVMHADLRTPGMMTTAYIVRDFGYMIFDTLVAQDSNFKIQPQMAEWKVSDDKLTYTFTLRDGLKWHDGAPVTAEDCVASLKRWGKADGMGQKLMDFTASIEATDTKTISLKLKEPYSLVLESIGKPSSLVPFMMPKRMAEAPTDKPLPELIGSGPFKFVPAEFQPGVKAVFEKNKDYVARKEPPSWTSGAKVVKVDRVEWITMADAQTAVNALQSGDIDFLEVPSYDILPVLAANKDIKIETPNKLGFQTVGRMNFLLPPFDDVKVRRAALLAMNQKDVLDALIGNPEYFKVCGAFFMCDRDHGARRCRYAEGAAGRRGAVVARRRLQGGPASHRLGHRGQPPRQPEADQGGRLEHVLHQLGRRRRDQSDRQFCDRRQGQERRLVRLGGRSQDGAAEGCVRACRHAGGAEEDRRRHPEGSL